ncbi:hypothetical protein [Methylobacterium nodulans]|nr:hypothetical protein [Methylobacterium nodulans]
MSDEPAIPRAPAAAAGDELLLITPPLAPPSNARKRKPGRPRVARQVASKQTVYLNDARHDALVEIAIAEERSMHSVILEAIDRYVARRRKPR